MNSSLKSKLTCIPYCIDLKERQPACCCETTNLVAWLSLHTQVSEPFPNFECGQCLTIPLLIANLQTLQSSHSLLSLSHPTPGHTPRWWVERTPAANFPPHQPKSMQSTKKFTLSHAHAHLPPPHLPLMSLYYETATLLTNPAGTGGSFKARIFKAKELKSKPGQIYALVAEASKWSVVLKGVIERCGVLSAEKKVLLLST